LTSAGVNTIPVFSTLAITSGDITDDTILAADIASAAITASELAEGIVNATHVVGALTITSPVFMEFATITGGDTVVGGTNSFTVNSRAMVCGTVQILEDGTGAIVDPFIVLNVTSGSAANPVIEGLEDLGSDLTVGVSGEVFLSNCWGVSGIKTGGTTIFNVTVAATSGLLNADVDELSLTAFVVPE